MTVRQWHITVHSLPGDATPGPLGRFDERQVGTLRVPGPNLSKPLPVTFDGVVSFLESWRGLLIEPDGSLVWVASAGRPWRIDGQLQDGREGLHYVELKTDAPRRPCEQLLDALGAAVEPLMVQFVREGIFVTAAAWLDLLDS